MNCFRITIFDRRNTTTMTRINTRHQLWIAFELLSLTDAIQLQLATTVSEYSCELLSNYYLWQTQYNNHADAPEPPLVVNCFRITIFDRRNTTLRRWSCLSFSVVNCFRITIFDRRNTTICRMSTSRVSCELLSNYYLWQTQYNAIRIMDCLSKNYALS